MDLITILGKITSPNQNELGVAQRFLEEASRNNFAEFLKSLSDVLQNTANDAVVRTAAGLQLKNALTSKDPEVRLECQRRWLNLPEEVRNYIKNNALSTLGTETVRPSSAAQCVAYIAVAELPHNFWPNCIQLLTQNVLTPASTELMKAATLEAIGYICQDIQPEILVNQSNDILTAIVNGMRREETNDQVKLAATTALLNSLEFTRSNFDNDMERHFIMQVVCETTQSSNLQIKVAALQCLVKIMSLYYQHMEHYMGPALFAITMQAMRDEKDEIALQGIEFWSNVCDEEVELAFEAQEAAEQNRPPLRTSRFYARGALQYLIPILTQTLTKQEEHDDEDDWNPCKAAGVCLMLMSTCCEDAIVPHVLPFVEGNITNPDWRYREAAVMAFGSILEGPNPNMLQSIVESALPKLLELMNDPQVAVRDTNAWALGRICETNSAAVLNPQNLPLLLNTFFNGLNSEPRVAVNICWAFSSLAAAAYENAPRDGDEDPATYALSTYFEPIVNKLLVTTERNDAGQSNLRFAAYEALMELIKNSSKDCYAVVQRATMVILQRLQQVLQLEAHVKSLSDRAQYNDLQSLLCATLQSVLRKMTPEDAPQISDIVMGALLGMFASSGKSGSVQEDALMAVCTLVEVLGEQFIKYMGEFRPYLAMGLKNHQEYRVCIVSVGLVGDICRALGAKVLPYCDSMMLLLMENLTDVQVNRSVKPHILTVFGDIALAIGVEFVKYLDIVMNTLSQAAQIQVDANDVESLEYIHELRETILEAYTGIVQGLKGDNQDRLNPQVQLLVPHLNFIMQFMITVAADQDLTDSLICAAAGLIGDLCTAFGVAILPMLDSEPITQMINKGRRSRTSKTKTLSTWAFRESRRLRTTPSQNNVQQ